MGARFSKKCYKKTIVLEHDDTIECNDQRSSPMLHRCDAPDGYMTDTQLPRPAENKRKKPKRNGPEVIKVKKVKHKRHKKTKHTECDRCNGDGFIRVNPKNKRRCATCLGTGLDTPCSLSKMWWNPQNREDGEMSEWDTSQRKLDGTKFTESDEIELPSLTPREPTPRSAFLSAGSVPTRSRIRFRSTTEVVEESGEEIK